MGEVRMRPKFVRVCHATARGVAERWRQQYAKPDGTWTKVASGDAGKIHEALCALGANPDVAEVARIIGNKTWSYIRCDGCNDDVTTAVEIGEWEAKPYCETCLREALAVLT